MIKDLIEKLKEKLIKNKKLTLIVIIGLLGIMLIFLSEVDTEKTKDKDEPTTHISETNNAQYEKQLEERLSDLISNIENAGQVKVMVTLKCSDESVYAINENIKNDDNSDNYSNSYVIIDNKSEKEGIKLKVIEPQVQGVAVVCTGGDNPEVIKQITDAVTKVLGIGSNKVSVSKMK